MISWNIRSVYLLDDLTQRLSRAIQQEENESLSVGVTAL